MEEIFGTVILAGGRSERMGFPKAFLDLSGETFLQKLTETYLNTGIKNICLVINKEFTEGVWKEQFNLVKPLIPAIIKTDSDFGRFHSLKLGINKLLSCDYVFIQNIDTPFVNKEIIRNLQDNRCSFGYTQLFYEGRKGHPVLVSKKIIQLISAMHGTEYNLKDILKGFPKTDVEVNDKRILANINTKEDYETYILAKA